VPRRRRADLQTFFTFGGRVPASVGLLVALVVVASILGAIAHDVAEFAALKPVAIRRGEIWRLVTWPFVETDVIGLLFGCYMLWWLGQQLSYAWSERRFLVRFLGYTLGAGVGTTLIAFVWSDASVGYVGMWPVVFALLIAWALMFPDRQVSFWGVLQMTGRMIALLTVALAILPSLFRGGLRGLGSVLPHIIAIGMAWVQSRGVGGRRSWFNARQWWAEREVRRRARHLKVVKKNGSGDRPRWMN
jgi:membrane associated rhomboid family serine protease